MKQQIRNRYLSSRLVFSIALLVGSAACSSVEVNHLADAQRMFSETATKENNFDRNLLSKTRVEDINAASLDSVAISNGYSAVLQILNQLSQEQVKSLQESGLWGNVLMLKVMSFWRLQRYSEAREILTNKIDKKTYDSLGDRDKVMYHVIAGLIQNDKFYQQMKEIEIGSASVEKTNMIHQGFISALESINRSLDKAAGNQQMRRYVLISYLGAYKNSQDACSLSMDKKARKACKKNKNCEAYANFFELEKTFDKKDLTGKSFLNNVLSKWLKKPSRDILLNSYKNCPSATINQ